MRITSRKTERAAEHVRNLVNALVDKALHDARDISWTATTEGGSDVPGGSELVEITVRIGPDTWCEMASTKPSEEQQCPS